jgi:hypothetical protein
VAFWWVNHKQTHRQEIEGGYIWSPQTNSNGARNETYLNLTRTAAGDVVFSYAGAVLRAVGVTEGGHAESPRPPEFGHGYFLQTSLENVRSGMQWEETARTYAVTLLHIDGRALPGSDARHGFDRDTILLPPVTADTLENAKKQVASLLRQANGEL